jgi:hypothetical protein
MASNTEMRTARLRWLLPVCNLAIDAFLIAAVVHATDVYRKTLKSTPPLWNQVRGPVNPMFLSEGYLPEPLIAIIAGTIPAALAATISLPSGWQESSPFDLRWALLYAVLAALLWHGIGRWAESASHPTLRKATKLFIVLRLILAPFSTSFRGSVWSGLSHILLLTAWSVAALYLLGRGVWLLYQRISSSWGAA